MYVFNIHLGNWLFHFIIMKTLLIKMKVSVEFSPFEHSQHVNEELWFIFSTLQTKKIMTHVKMDAYIYRPNKNVQ